MGNVWAIGDLHLSFGTPDKEMGIFGAEWKDHHAKIASFWDSHVHADDLVLIPGDISWAMKLEEAIPDLEWIHKRPGTKVLIKGNHDYWWGTTSKVRKVLPPSIHVIWNDAFQWNDVSIAGTRLWDSDEYSFAEYVAYKETAKAIEPAPHHTDEDKKIFLREIGRLQMSLQAMNKEITHKIVMTHYPPIGADLKDSHVSRMLEEGHIDIVVFGHLHSLKKGAQLFGEKNGVRYFLTSCDWLDFRLLRLPLIKS